MESATLQSPSTVEELASALGEARGSVRVRGAGTKLAWAPGASARLGRARSEAPGASEAIPDLELTTERLDRIVEHNAGDLTAVLEAGVPLARAQETFAAAGQMFALDPPDLGATIGGVLATADSGPLRARYGGARDLVVGIRVALADGTVAKSGGKVIKNVAGYDLAKLFAGSYGTLGAILEVSVRLHPLPPATATAIGRSPEPEVLAAGAMALSHARIEQLGLDVRWAGGAGAVLSRFGGAAPAPQAAAAERVLREAGLDTEIDEHDDALWQAQREGQRSPAGLVVRVSALQTELPELLRIAERHGATLVGRAGLGLSWLRLDHGDPDALVRALRMRWKAVVLDRPAGLTEVPGPPLDPQAEALMARVKERFDPENRLV
jgi:glycolate oxidase FAD binding subunit